MTSPYRTPGEVTSPHRTPGEETDHLRRAAAQVGFVLSGADGVSGMLSAPGSSEPAYVGGYAELRAYLSAWSACAEAAGLGRPASGLTYDQVMLGFSSVSKM